MADDAHRITDEKLEKMERHLSAIYSRAEKEIEKTAADYLERFQKQDAEKLAQVSSGKITQKEYQQWRTGKIMYGKRYTEMKQQVAAQLLNVNKTAMAYINEELPEVYALNYNALEPTVEGVGGYSFTLTDADTVKNLATSDKTLLPYKMIDGKKDVRWNTKKVNAEVLQGILQGDSIPKIAKRLQNVTEMNKTSAIRNARTTVTSAECKGRQDSYERATKDGIQLQREWMATNDGRTRHSHRLLDGQRTEVDKPFDSELGEIMYPGDPHADPANVYNCRCTIIAKVMGFAKDIANKTEQYIQEIEKGRLFEGLDEERKENIVHSIENGDERIVKMIAESSKNCSVDWHVGEIGTSQYTEETGNIIMYGNKDGKYFPNTFWHEYGHFIDDERLSKTGVIKEGISKSGTTRNYYGTTEIAKKNGYYDAAVKDINDFLEKSGLSDKYYYSPSGSDYMNPFMIRKSDGKRIMAGDREDLDILEDAVERKFSDLSGRSELNNFWKEKGKPEEVEYEKYFETYITPKRQQVKTRERYKGAQEDFLRDSIEYGEKMEKFTSKNNLDDLEKEYNKLEAKVKDKEILLGFVADTFDGAASGSFSTCIALGGHTEEYYRRRDLGIKEGAANVFSCMATGNEVQKKAFEEMCPNVFRVLSEATVYGK